MTDLSKLKPFVQLKAEMLTDLVEKVHKKLCIYCTYRSPEQQEEEFKKGTTKVHGGYSYHQYGLAFDCALLNAKGGIDWNDSTSFDLLGKLGKSLGLEWGGDFKVNGKPWPDKPHFQYTCGLTCAKLIKGVKPAFPSLQDEYKKYAPLVYGDNYKAKIDELNAGMDPQKKWKVEILTQLRETKIKNQNKKG